MEKTEIQYKNDIIEICKRVHANGWVAANDGNVSIRLGQNEVLCTPTGMSKGYLQCSQLIKVDMDGNKLEGEFEPSSEIKMHLDVYKNKDGVNAVVHAHPPVATGFAASGIRLDECIMPEIIIGLGSIPTAKFGTPSTMEIPESIRPYLKNYDVYLLENHGALSVGKDVFQAYYRMESLELFAKINLVARMLGNVNVLSEENAKKTIEVRKKFGLDDSNYPGCRIDGKMIRGGAGESIIGGSDVTGAVNAAGSDVVSYDGTASYDAGSPDPGGNRIVITREGLVRLVTGIVTRIMEKSKN